VFATGSAVLQLHSCSVRGGLRAGVTVVGSKLLGSHVTVRPDPLFASPSLPRLTAPLTWLSSSFRSFLSHHPQISDNAGAGVSSLDSVVYLENSYLTRNGGSGASALGTSTLYLRHCEVRSNAAPMHVDPECAVHFRRCSGDAEAERLFTIHPASAAFAPPSSPQGQTRASGTTLPLSPAGVIPEQY
jgi:hypothetical protein